MTKTEQAALATLSDETLVEGFITEAKLSDPLFGLPVEKANEHMERFYAYAAAISTRGGLPSLLQLIDSPDIWLAYCTGDRLADLEETRDRALAVLDRIADARIGYVSYRANTARNVVRYGHPSGDPVETEKRLAKIVADERERKAIIAARFK